MNSPVFIIGGSRTGSELLKGILEKYSQCAFVNEMHLLDPAWLHEDFSSAVTKELGGFGTLLSGASIVELAKHGRFYGYFWQEFVNVIDENKFCRAFDATNRQLNDVLEVSMQLYADYKGKDIRGAKFPVHYSFVDKLMEWYPGCRIIHTVRDPRAIYASQSTKYAKHANSKFAASIIRVKQFAHINIQTKWTYRIHERLSGRDNYHLAVYEDLVCNTENYFNSLCAFLDIKLVEEMLNPTAFSNSSFDVRKGTSRTLQKEAIDAYKRIVNPITVKLIESINKKEMVGLGYI